MRTIAAACVTLVLIAGCVSRRQQDDAHSQSTGSAPSAITTKSGVEMVLLPGGRFQMGSDDPEETDQPPHPVCVSPFYIDTHEVTQQEYEKLMGSNPSLHKGPTCPVEQVRWAGAIACCNERSRREGLRPAYDLKTGKCDFQADGYRLPTEAEWEYAARAGTTTAYSFGSDPAELGDHAWFKGNCTRGSQPVGGKRPNAWGLYDTSGNVWEWCQDFYDEDYYRHSPERDPHGPESGTNRVVRGGCWNSRARECRPSYRNYEIPAFTDTCFGKDIHGLVGFRCVRSAPAK